MVDPLNPSAQWGRAKVKEATEAFVRCGKPDGSDQLAQNDDLKVAGDGCGKGSRSAFFSRDPQQMVLQMRCATDVDTESGMTIGGLRIGGGVDLCRDRHVAEEH